MYDRSVDLFTTFIGLVPSGGINMFLELIIQILNAKFLFSFEFFVTSILRLFCNLGLALAITYMSKNKFFQLLIYCVNI